MHIRFQVLVKYVLLAVALCSIICLHELGHWAAATVVGFNASYFSVGLGQPYLRLGAVNGTELRLTPWLLGGAVHINEISRDDSQKADRASTRSSNESKKEPEFWKVVAVLMAGPATNLLLAVVLLTCLYRRRGMLSGLRTSIEMCLTYSVEILMTVPRVLAIKSVPRNLKCFEYCQLFSLLALTTTSATNALRTLAAISLSLAVLNIVPLPVVDGGQVLLPLYEPAIMDYFDAGGERILLALCKLAVLLLILFMIVRNAEWPVFSAPQDAPARADA